MGVPRFFLWVLKNHPQCLIQLKEGETFMDHNIYVEAYALDSNAIIHPVCQKMYSYGLSDVKKSFLHTKKKTPQSVPHEKQVYSRVCQKNDELRAIVKPTKIFIQAIDGVAGLSKQTQQRQRRFRSSLERDKSQPFDSNKITTGSEFMTGLSKYIHINIQRQMSENIEWRDLEVVLSNEKVPGEGEHKIIQYIKKNPDMTFCIDSPDADLLMLTLSLKNPKLYIFRENIYKNVNCKYFAVDVCSLRGEIINQFRWGSVKHKCNDTQLVYDFILICFMLGNDFLPHIPSLEISNEGLDVLIETYPRIATNHGHLVYRSKETNELSLNTKALCQLFYSLAQGECERLLKKSEDRSLDFPDTILRDCVNEISKDVSSSSSGTFRKLDFNKYRKAYYEKKLHDCEPYDVCHEYFKGMLFVLRYYVDEIPDFQWFYPFHKSPFFVDMYECVEDFDGEMKFEKNEPLSSFEQLLAVMPPGSVDILPPALRCLVTDEDSPIADFYPSSFDIDFDGKKKEWEGQAILPFIDVKRLKDAYNTKKTDLTEFEQKRNQPGKNIKYFNHNGQVKTSFF